MRTNPSPHDGEALLELSKALAAYRKHGDEMLKALEATEDQLAAAEAALREIDEFGHRPTVQFDGATCGRIARAALATYRAKETEA